MELQLRRLQRARQTRPPLGPQGLPLSTAMPPAAPVESPGFKKAPKGLPRLERMDTRDSMTEMECRDSFTAPATPLSPHPGSSNTRSKGRKAVTAVTPPPPPQKQVDKHAKKSLLDDLATTLKSVADGQTECFGFENMETQLRLWRGPVHRDAGSTTLDLCRSTNVEVQRDALLSAVLDMGKQALTLRKDHPHRELAKLWFTYFNGVATKDRTEIYFVLDNPAKPTTLESSTMTRVDSEAVRVLQELVRRCGGAVKQPPRAWKMGLRGIRMQPRAQSVRAKVWAQFKARISAKRSLAKGRARDAKAASS